MKRRAIVLATALVSSLCACAPSRRARLLESFDDPAGWVVDASDDVHAALRPVAGNTAVERRAAEDRALQLDFDFRGRAGHVGVRRALPSDWPENFELSLYVKGEALPNDFQLKLLDASGENVWWFREPGLSLSPGGTRLRFRRRELEFAWGPTQDRTLRRSAAIELVLAANQGGQGSVIYDDLRLQELPLPPPVPPPPVARASSSAASSPAALAVDGQASSAWHSDPGAGPEQRFELDLGYVRDLGGLVIDWGREAAATRYDVELSSDRALWRLARQVTNSNGGRDALALPEAEARWIRLSLHAGPSDHYAIANVSIEPPEFAQPNHFVQALARTAPRGHFPRAFSGEQNTWTLVGTDGGPDSALLSEDGALEVGAGGFSIEPFLTVANRIWSWADVQSEQSLRDGYLPIPSVTWRSPAQQRSPEWQLRITAWAASEPAPSGTLTARYELTNRSSQPLDAQLVLAVRPLQVNPPAQSLNLAGGVSPIGELDWDGQRCRVNGSRSVVFLAPPDHVQLAAFDANEFPVQPGTGGPGAARPVEAQHVSDPARLASGLFGYDLHVPAGNTVRLALLVPLAPNVTSPLAAASEEAVAAAWREKLNRTQISVPAAAQPVVDTLRTSLAYLLMSRAGPLLRPGTRSYARSWIRDGALMSEALLQLGHAQLAASYFDAYAPYQFANGKVPCCLDGRGADPVPEHDSPGELIFLAAEHYRFTADRAQLERAWPHIEAAANYLDALRAQERTAQNQAPDRRAYYGLLPPSISHEGYSDKPAYSYWDDFWALIGYQDAAYVAEVLERSEARERLARSRDEFRSDLYASLRESVAQHSLAFLPASADRGDLDPTATTIALAPGREAATLPGDLLRATFERYWQSFEARRSGEQSWDAYTPYELRVIGSFVRLGWRERAQELLRYFLADRSPPPWNGWAEVVLREPRKPRFIGDRPHAWIASDYIRSVLDSFAYARDSDHALVLAAGVPPEWLDNSGLAVRGLRTREGAVDYSAVRTRTELGQKISFEIRGAAPSGGFALPWLWSGSSAPARVTINGVARRWVGDELRIERAPAHIVIESTPP